ncbi:MAG: phage integrase N-terminal SAM-like domain-containing protein [Cyclobacteriaceae bacterium]
MEHFIQNQLPNTNYSKMQTLTVPSLQGTLAKPAMPTLQPNFAKEPFSPSRSNAGQRYSAAKINRLDNELKNGQLVEQAIVLVPEFEKVAGKLEQQVTLRGQSNSTLQNYIRRIALFVVHFGKLPEQMDAEQINEYLVALTRDPKSPSRSSFKHMVYGLRYYYRLMGLNKNAIALPFLKKDTKLPLILNRQKQTNKGLKG